MENDNRHLVTLGKYPTAVEANIIAGVLNDNGVHAGVVGDSTANALLGTPMRVVVFDTDLERAQQILASQPDPSNTIDNN